MSESDQVQCPNCGGYRVGTEIESIDLQNGTKVDFGCGYWFFLLMGILMVIGGTSGVLDVVYGKPMEDVGGQMCLLPVGLLFAIPLIVMIIRIFKTPMTKRYCHTCWLCGYKWNRRAGEPLPKVTLRPDLIVAGEQRLHDEEEQRKRAIAYDILNRKD